MNDLALEDFLCVCVCACMCNLSFVFKLQKINNIPIVSQQFSCYNNRFSLYWFVLEIWGYLFICVHFYAHVYLYMYMYICICVYLYVHTSYVYECACVRVYVCIYMYTYMCLCLCMHAWVYVRLKDVKCRLFCWKNTISFHFISNFEVSFTVNKIISVYKFSHTRTHTHVHNLKWQGHALVLSIIQKVYIF